MQIQFQPYVFHPYRMIVFMDFYLFPSDNAGEIYSMLAEEMEDLRRDLAVQYRNFQEMRTERMRDYQMTIAELHKRMKEG